MKAVTLVIAAAFLTVGCEPKPAGLSKADLYWQRVPTPEVGELDSASAEALTKALLAVPKSAPASQIEKLLPAGTPRVPLVFHDASPHQPANKPAGGNVMDYWINGQTVVRVAVGYYGTGETAETRVEWLKILSREEAYDLEAAVQIWPPRRSQ